MVSRPANPPEEGGTRASSPRARPPQPFTYSVSALPHHPRPLPIQPGVSSLSMTYVSSVPYSRSIVAGPPLHPPPEDVAGFPTLEDIHSYPVMFSWDDLKDIIRTRSVLTPASHDVNAQAGREGGEFGGLEERTSSHLRLTRAEHAPSGLPHSDLARLRRPPGLQKRYDAWAEDVKYRYGGGSTGLSSLSHCTSAPLISARTHISVLRQQKSTFSTNGSSSIVHPRHKQMVTHRRR